MTTGIDTRFTRNYIGGEWRLSESGQTRTNVNPGNLGDVIGEFAESGAPDVDAAVAAAKEALRPGASWARSSGPSTSARRSGSWSGGPRRSPPRSAASRASCSRRRAARSSPHWPSSTSPPASPAASTA